MQEARSLMRIFSELGDFGQTICTASNGIGSQSIIIVPHDELFGVRTQLMQVIATERFGFCIVGTLCASGDRGGSLSGSPGSFEGACDPPASCSCVQAPSSSQPLEGIILPVISSNATLCVAWDELKRYGRRQERK